MTNYIMECNHTEELESAMYNSKVFPLVAELHKKFNLYVIQQIYMKDQGSDDWSNLPSYSFIDSSELYPETTSGIIQNDLKYEGYTEAFVLANSVGVPTCLAYIEPYARDKNRSTYVVRFRMSVKSRSSDSCDAQSIRSLKVSQLMKAVESTIACRFTGISMGLEPKVDVGASYPRMCEYFKLNNKSLQTLKNDKYAHVTYKMEKFVPSLLDHYLNGTALSTEEDARLQEVVKGVEHLDEAVREVEGRIVKGLHAGFTMVGVSQTKGVIVGDMSLAEDRKWSYTNVKRYETLEDYPAFNKITLALTMRKVRLLDSIKDKRDIYKDYHLRWRSDGMADEELGMFEMGDVDNNPLAVRWLLIPREDES